jgi:hypothetical protein
LVLDIKAKEVQSHMSKIKLEGVVGITTIKVPQGNKASKRLNLVKACSPGPSQGVETASII